MNRRIEHRLTAFVPEHRHHCASRRAVLLHERCVVCGVRCATLGNGMQHTDGRQQHTTPKRAQSVGCTGQDPDQQSLTSDRTQCGRALNPAATSYKSVCLCFTRQTPSRKRYGRRWLALSSQRSPRAMCRATCAMCRVRVPCAVPVRRWQWQRRSRRQRARMSE